MAIRFMDSFDHWAIGDYLSKWTSSSHTTQNVSITTGRHGSGYQAAGYGDRTLSKVFDTSPQDTWICGVAVNWASFAQTFAFISFRDGASAQCEVRTNSSNRLYVARNGTTLGTGTTTLQTGVWYYVEFKVVIHDSTGVAVVKLNETTEINLSGVDTRNAGTTCDTFQLGDRGSFGGTITWDDLYVLDGTGSSPTNDFLGDVRVQALSPNANGNTSNLVGSDGNSTDNYLLVDESTPNGDTDYVEAAAVGDKDTYNYGALTPTTGSVYGIQILPYARKTDAGTRKIATVARHSGTEEDSADLILGSSYTYLPNIRETKPGGGAWSISDINAAEFGVKVTA